MGAPITNPSRLGVVFFRFFLSSFITGEANPPPQKHLPAAVFLLPTPFGKIHYIFHHPMGSITVQRRSKADRLPTQNKRNTLDLIWIRKRCFFSTSSLMFQLPRRIIDYSILLLFSTFVYEADRGHHSGGRVPYCTQETGTGLPDDQILYCHLRLNLPSVTLVDLM